MDRVLRIHVEDHHPVAVIRLSGFCAQLEVYKLKSECEWQITDGKRFLLFSLNELNFIDSAGIGVIIQIVERCRSAGGHLSLVCKSGSNVRRLLSAALLQHTVDFYEDEAEALTGIAQKFGLSIQPQPELESLGEVAQLKARLEELERRMQRLEDDVSRSRGAAN